MAEDIESIVAIIVRNRGVFILQMRDVMSLSEGTWILWVVWNWPFLEKSIEVAGSFVAPFDCSSDHVGEESPWIDFNPFPNPFHRHMTVIREVQDELMGACEG